MLRVKNRTFNQNRRADNDLRHCKLGISYEQERMIIKEDLKYRRIFTGWILRTLTAVDICARNSAHFNELGPGTYWRAVLVKH